MAASYIKVKIDSEEIDRAKLANVNVSQELNQHWWAHVECRQTEDVRFPVERWLGKSLQVVSHDQEGNDLVLFDGFVLEVELEYEVYGSYATHVTAVTQSYKMSLTPRKAYYQERKLKDLAQKLAGYFSLQASVQCKDRRTLNYVQWGETDWDFLRRMADDYSSWIRPTADGIEIYDTFQDGTDLLWRGESGEKSLLNFVIRGALSQPSFDGAHYNHHEMKSQVFQRVQSSPNFSGSVDFLVNAVQDVSKEKFPPGYLYERNRAITLDEYQDQLKKESVRSIGSNVVGNGSSRNPALCPGNKVEITGDLEPQGTYGVTRVVHRWTPQGYQNEFTCTPWMDYTDPHPPEAKLWFGTVPARVVEHNDPKQMGRIKVKYYWQEDDPTHWARMLTPHAGADRGFMFMPEVGDEVLVGFEDGDPERPYIMGCLWNGVHKAPRDEFWGGDIDPNDVKRIVTKSGHRIQLSDKEGKESIVIATPKELKLSLIETTDETGRSMITLHTENGDMFFSAPNGRIHFRSKLFSREVG